MMSNHRRLENHDNGHDERHYDGQSHHCHQPPLSSLVYPHLHSILLLAAEYDLPEPTWSAGKPTEKRSESSDKTITPSSSSTIKGSSTGSRGQGSSGDEKGKASNPPSSLSKQRSLNHAECSSVISSKRSAPSSPSRSAESNQSTRHDSLLIESSQSNTLILSPASEKSQLDLSSSGSGNGSPPRRDSRESSPVAPLASKKKSSDTKKKGKESGGTATDNELWIQVADCVKVVADALRDEHLRGPLGTDSFVVHLLTLFSLTMTHRKSSASVSVSRYEAHAQKSLKKSPSSESLTNAASKLNGIQHAQLQCLRCLANLCIDNDDNRSELIAYDAPLFILRLIKDVLASEPSVEDPCFDAERLVLLKTAMGALLNLQLDNSESRRWLLKLPPAGSKRYSLHHNGGSDDDLTDEDHRSAHPNWHNPNIYHHPNLPEGGGGPFDMPESGTIVTLLEVATDPRIYSPAFAIKSVLGQDPKEEGDVDWRPPSGQWERVELGAEVVSWAARVTEDLLNFELEEAKAAQGNGSDIDVSMLTLPSKIAIASHDEAWTWLSRALQGFTPAPQGSAQGSKPHCHEPDSDGPEDAMNFLDADLTVLSLCGELLEACANIYQGNAPAAVQFKRKGLPKLDGLLSFLENATSPFGTTTPPTSGLLEQYGLAADDVAMMAKEVSKAKSNIVKAIVSLVGEDENMAELFASEGESPFLLRMKSWLQIHRSKREDLVSCALLSIANLARSDENCVALVRKHDLVPLLLSLLRGKTSMLLSHATLGLFKNLCIPVPNKKVIGASNIFDHLPSYLCKDHDHAQPIQFAAVGIAKQLAYCATDGLERNVAALCRGAEGPNGSTFEALLDLIGRTEDTPTKLEATRVLVNIIRTLWASSGQQGGEEIDLSPARKQIRESRTIAALCDMLRRGGKYPILLNEAIIGLTLLASSESPESAVTIAHALLGQHSVGNIDDDSASSEGEGKDTIKHPSSTSSANAQDLLSRVPPARSSTMDSMMSTYSSATVIAAPDSAIDVLYEVLSLAGPASTLTSSSGEQRDNNQRRRDVPIEFAENTCTLLSTLVGGIQVGKGDAAKDLSIKLLPALRGFKGRNANCERASTSKAVQRALASCENAVKGSS